MGGPGAEVLAAWADGRIDISERHWSLTAPDAVEAILDYHFPDGRHRDDQRIARVRLQLLAELHVGSVMRAEAAAEEAKLSVLRKRRAANGI